MRPQLDSVAARYMRCLASGLPANTGVPDGDGRLSFVFNRKFVTVLKPDATGALMFEIGFSAHGSISVLKGLQANATLYPTYRAATGTSALTQWNSNQGLVFQPPGVGVSPGLSGPRSPTRLVNARHQIEYTGAPLNASGHVTAFEVRDTVHSSEEKFTWATGGGSVSVEAIQAMSGDTAYLPPSAFVSAARNPVHVLMVPRSSDYHTSRAIFRDVTSTDYPPFGMGSSSTLVPGDLAVGYAGDPSVRVRRFVYSGLDPNGSIVVTSDVCCQVLLNDEDPYASMGRPSEAASQSWLSNFLAQLNTQPLISASKAALTNAAITAANHALGIAGGMVTRTALAAITAH